MARNTLSDSERRLLSVVIERYDRTLLPDIEELGKKPPVAVVVDRILHYLSTEVAAKGFGPDYEPTIYGRAVEDLISKIVRLYKIRDVN